MRSLFLKIFLSFWATQVLVGLALVVSWSMQPQMAVSRWRSSTSEAVVLYAQSAAEELDRYGAPALENFLQRVYNNGHVRASLFTADGRLIAGTPSQTARGLVARSVQPGEPEYIVRPERAFAAQRAVGPSGNTYILVAELPRGPFGAARPPVQAELFRWGVTILVSGFICYLLTRYLARPILRLRGAARGLAAGDLSARAGTKMERRRDEIGDLVRDFNRMADRIETLVNSQRQLISDISHELRSPLARLNVALALARRGAGDAASDALDRIEQESERLNEMIGKLLNLARMDAVTSPPELVTVDLEQLVSEIVADANFEAQERGCQVRLVTAEACASQGSVELLRSAMENVIRNAIRYTARGTDVEVALECQCRGPQTTQRNGDGNGVPARDDWAQLTVRDHGPGVPEAELPNLFQPFYRVANARERQTGGAGLGLAITARAVRLHGGTVEARNAADGGLIIDVRLPLVSVPAQVKAG